LSAGREDLARAALQNKAQLQTQYADLEGKSANLQEQEEKLTLASQRLDAKVQDFRTRKETIKATYTAAEAQTRINEAFSGNSEAKGGATRDYTRKEYASTVPTTALKSDAPGLRGGSPRKQPNHTVGTGPLT